MATALDRSLVEMREVSMEFAARDGTIHAVDRVSLSVPEGAFVCVVGPSGCGKTTLLRVIAGFVAPTAGQAVLDGIPIEGPDHQRGVVFQQPTLYPWLTVRQNVEFGPKMRGIAPARRRELAEHYLRMVRLWEFRDKAPYELSGGMQQRVALVRAFALGAPILLMDEPFAALDEMTRAEMRYLLLGLWERHGATVLFVTHSIGEAVMLSDRIVVLTPRPARVAAVEVVTLPRPRHAGQEDTVAFLEHVTRVRHSLHSTR
jgi:sulfonate transport system ATP-binding protein